MADYFYTDERNAQIVISLLKAHGIKKVVASPGTTNICLVASLQQDPFFEIYSAADERSAGYIACGLSSESGEPVVLSCTGATASRNYMSALTEAYYRKLPILVITSSRSNFQIGHNIDQVTDRTVLPNDVAKLSVQLPLIYNNDEAEWGCVIAANKAILELSHHGNGPVHINLETNYSWNYNIKELPETRAIYRFSNENDLPKLNKKDIYTLVIFIIVLILWIIPSLFEYIWPSFYELFNTYGTSMPPLLGALALCVIRVDNEPLLKVDDAFKNGVPWSSLIMCAATLALGAALQNSDIGLISYLQTTLGPALNSLPEIFLLIIFAFWAALQTNLSSNMVTATLVATVASTILLSTNNTLNISATICIIGMLASFAFATPPSMPHIAIICSDESTSTKDVLIYGSIMMILSVLVSLLVAYPLGTLIF